MTVHRSLLKPRVVAHVTFALHDKIELRLEAGAAAAAEPSWVRGSVVAVNSDGSYDVEHQPSKKKRKKGAKPPPAVVEAAVRSERMRRVGGHAKGKSKKGKGGKKGGKKSKGKKK